MAKKCCKMRKKAKTCIKNLITKNPQSEPGTFEPVLSIQNLCVWFPEPSPIKRTDKKTFFY